MNLSLEQRDFQRFGAWGSFVKGSVLGVVLWLALAGVACAAIIPADTINGFRKGQTSKAEVVAGLGAPVMQSGMANGGSVLRYDYTAPPQADGAPGKNVIILFMFNGANVFQGIQLYAKDDDAEKDAAGPSPSARPMADLRDENVLTPMPDGFRIGAQGDSGPVHTTELVPVGETADVWTRMITQQTVRGRRAEAPSNWPTQLAASWRRACPGGSAEALTADAVNGYSATLWRFVCPLNPATQKPETMWMRTISGADALYSVQYAYRRALTTDMETEAVAYLKTVSVCDTRSDAHPCPR